MENYERDIAWLLKVRPQSTEDEQEAFAEKTAVIIAEQSLKEIKALRKAYSALFINDENLT